MGQRRNCIKIAFSAKISWFEDIGSNGFKNMLNKNAAKHILHSYLNDVWIELDDDFVKTMAKIKSNL